MKTRRREESQRIFGLVVQNGIAQPKPISPQRGGRDASWERTHLACSVNNRETVSTLEACAPRETLCVLRVSAVRFGVQA